MSMRPLNFGQVPAPGASVTVQLDYCVRALKEIERWSNENSAKTIAQGFTMTNVTVDRTFNADTVAVAELADIVGTLIADLARGGSKRT